LATLYCFKRITNVFDCLDWNSFHKWRRNRRQPTTNQNWEWQQDQQCRASRYFCWISLHFNTL